MLHLSPTPIRHPACRTRPMAFSDSLECLPSSLAGDCIVAQFLKCGPGGTAVFRGLRDQPDGPVAVGYHRYGQLSPSGTSLTSPATAAATSSSAKHDRMGNLLRGYASPSAPAARRRSGECRRRRWPNLWSTISQDSSTVTSIPVWNADNLTAQGTVTPSSPS